MHVHVPMRDSQQCANRRRMIHGIPRISVDGQRHIGKIEYLLSPPIFFLLLGFNHGKALISLLIKCLLYPLALHFQEWRTVGERSWRLRAVYLHFDQCLDRCDECFSTYKEHIREAIDHHAEMCRNTFCPLFIQILA